MKKKSDCKGNEHLRKGGRGYIVEGACEDERERESV